MNPAIALAAALPDGAETLFIGTEAGAEARLVPAAGYRLECIDVAGFDRSRPLTLPAVGMRALRATRQSGALLRDFRAEVVVGMGGYVSLPTCLAASRRRIPVVLHEQNIVFGLAHRVTKPIARRVAVSWRETLHSAGRKGVWTGNPVMPALTSIDRRSERRKGLERFRLDPDRRTVLVFGGSQGATRVNDAAAGLVSRWEHRSDIQIVHILGSRGSASMAVPEGGNLIYRAVAYVDSMAEAYSVADVAVCRGGASTVAELTVVGLPAVIVPYPYHRDRQQVRHAEVLAAAGAAVVLPDDETTSDRLAAELVSLLDDPNRLDHMRSAAASLGRPTAAQDLASVVGEVVP